MREAQQNSELLMRDILGEDYADWAVEKSVFEEDMIEGTSRIVATIAPRGAAPDHVERGQVEATGKGVVDAFFKGLVARFSEKYVSLTTLAFVGFKIDAKLDESIESSHTDAVGVVTLLVQNDQKRDFEFVASARSITAAALQATLAAVQYFINSERAFFATRRALEDAKSRNRPDLVATFSSRLAELVRNTSYSEAIAARDTTR